MRTLYDTTRWRLARTRALQRDGNRCTVSRLIGGDCTATLHVHHLVRPEDGGSRYALENLGTTCSAHHPMWEAVRRSVLARVAANDDPPPRCPHFHPTAEARRQCEARMARRRRRAAAA